MANDVHYMIIFVIFFLTLGIISPLIDEEFSSGLSRDHKEVVLDGTDPSGDAIEIDTILGIPVGVLKIIGNIFVIPFYTFGLPLWINLWILLPFRIVFIFLIARNIWVGGGG